MPYKDRAKRLEYLKKWREKNPDHFKKWSADNQEHRVAYMREYCKEWRKRNPEYGNEYTLRRRSESIQYKLAGNLRSRLRQAIALDAKTGSAVSDLGCSIDELKIHLESQFTTGMSWDNYGSVWEIDHVIPLYTFDLTDRAQLLKACNHLNLRPLGVRENRGRCNGS